MTDALLLLLALATSERTMRGVHCAKHMCHVGYIEKLHSTRGQGRFSHSQAARSSSIDELL